jgi:type IV fimbrial biogenesis protein FimT
MTQATQNRLPRSRRQRGVTLIETAVVTAIIGVAASVVGPGMGRLKSDQQVANAAAEFETAVQQTRSAAVSRNAPLRISFDSRNGASCYIVHTGAAGDCECGSSGSAVCTGEAEALRSVHFGAAAGSLAMNANVRSMVFDPVKGTSTPAGTVKITGINGNAVHQVVNIMGRVRSCSPGKAIQGYKAC